MTRSRSRHAAMSCRTPSPTAPPSSGCAGFAQDLIPATSGRAILSVHGARDGHEPVTLEAPMKALLAASLVVGTALFGGCATPQYTAEDLDGRVVCDQATMSAIEH